MRLFMPYLSIIVKFRCQLLQKVNISGLIKFSILNLIEITVKTVAKLSHATADIMSYNLWLSCNLKHLNK